MKPLLILSGTCQIILCLCFAASASAQGVFVGSSGATQTHIGSLLGPLAGPNIAGQMMGGSSPGSLEPVGPLAYHNDGNFLSGNISVPSVPAYQFAYVQLLAWDTTIWGADLSVIPLNQLGRTDIVTVFLTTDALYDIRFFPRFTQSAVVPIPEPSLGMLMLFGFGGLGIRRLFRVNIQ